MQPLKTLDCVETPEGRELVLYQRGDTFLIQIDGYDLMSNRSHGSEQEMARLALADLGDRPAPRVLVGGLGMGYTLRTTLDLLGDRPAAVVVVAEVFPAVLKWNRGVLGHLAGQPLADARARIELVDVGKLIARSGPPWDVILLDVDNGPEAFSLDTNRHLYSARGLDRLRGALAPKGVLAVWSAHDDPRFSHRLRRAGFSVSTRRVRARASGKGERHQIFLARRP